MYEIIQANDNSLKNVLERILPPKKKRISNANASVKVKKSVKGKTSGITTEQGFRNYLKYTDPMLQESDETTDTSKIAKDLSEILSAFKPHNVAPHILEPDKQVIEKVKKHLVKEPVENRDLANEIVALPISRQLFADKPEERQNRGIEKIQAIYKGKNVREQLKGQEKDKNTTLKTFGNSIIMQVPTSPMKKIRNELEDEKQIWRNEIRVQEQKKEKTKATLSRIGSIVRGHKARKETKPFIEVQAKRMKDNSYVQGSQVNRLENGKFDKRALGNNRTKKVSNDTSNFTSPVKKL